MNRFMDIPWALGRVCLGITFHGVDGRGRGAGSFQQCGENHGRCCYKKDSQANIYESVDIGVRTKFSVLNVVSVYNHIYVLKVIHDLGE